MDAARSGVIAGFVTLFFAVGLFFGAIPIVGPMIFAMVFENLKKKLDSTFGSEMKSAFVAWIIAAALGQFFCSWLFYGMVKLGIFQVFVFFTTFGIILWFHRRRREPKPTIIN